MWILGLKGLILYEQMYPEIGNVYRKVSTLNSK